jgi:hypothetical protein
LLSRGPKRDAGDPLLGQGNNHLSSFYEFCRVPCRISR